MLEKEWQNYVEELLESKKPYVSTKKTKIVKEEFLIEKTARSEDMVITWTENTCGDIVDVKREYR